MSSKTIYIDHISMKPSVYEKYMSMTECDSVPFTYLIGWTKHNIWYYGVKFAIGCKPTDLWTKYFTSSKLVEQYSSDLGTPDVLEIRRIFDTKEQALSWEGNVLRRLNVKASDKWANMSNGSQNQNWCAFLDEHGVDNTSQIPEVKLKKIETCLRNFGVANPLHSPLVQEKIVNTNLERYGCERPAQNKDVHDKMTQTCLEKYGVENPFQSEEIKDKIKEICLEKYGVDHHMKNPEIKSKHTNKMKEIRRTREPRKCPHCPMESRNYTNMTRYHFDNCKHKE